jgi:hypothetical protein
MSYVKEPFVPGQPFERTPEQIAEENARPPGTLETMPPKMLDRVTVQPTPEELRRARTSDAPLTFLEKLEGGFGGLHLWDDPAGYRMALEDSNRRADAMIRGVTKAGTGLVDLATTAVQYSPIPLAVNALTAKEPTTADLVAGRQPQRTIDIPNITQPVQDFLTDIGIAKPETATERRLETVTEYVSPVGMLRKIPVKAFQEAIPLQAAAATSGGLAESMARESGATDIEQKAAGILTSLGVLVSPGALNLTKRMLAGGAKPEQIEQAIRDFERLGATPTAGQASDSSIVQTVEQGLSNYPGSATVIADVGQAQQQAIGAKVAQMAKDLAPRSSPTTAGEAIEQGAEAFRQRSIGKGGTAERMYSEADALIGKNHTVQLPNTGRLIDEITTPIQGLRASSQAIAEPGTIRLAEALKADMLAAETAGLPGLPYEGLKAYRSKVGELIGDSLFNPGQNTAQLKALYANLTADIEASFANNPKALSKLKAANEYYKKSQSWLDDVGAQLDKAGGPEKIFTRLVTGVSDGATQLERVMRVLSPEQRRVVASAFLKKLGSKAKGADDASLVEQFDTTTFLRNYNNLSKEAKRALFGRNQFGPTFTEDMAAVARVAKSISESGAYLANRPGTARQVATGSVLSTILALPSFIGAFAGGGGAAAMAGAASLVKTALVSTGVAYSAAKLMSNPKYVRWLASVSKMPPAAGAAQVDLLAKANRDDEDIQQFAQEWKQYNQPTLKPAPGPRQRNGFVAEPYNPNEVK